MPDLNTYTAMDVEGLAAELREPAKKTDDPLTMKDIFLSIFVARDSKSSADREKAQNIRAFKQTVDSIYENEYMESSTKEYAINGLLLVYVNHYAAVDINVTPEETETLAQAKEIIDNMRRRILSPPKTKDSTYAKLYGKLSRH
jgi:hypothetical protein